MSKHVEAVERVFVDAGSVLAWGELGRRQKDKNLEG
jgi:hypothetical protein